MTWFIEVILEGGKNAHRSLYVETLLLRSSVVTGFPRRCALPRNSVIIWSILNKKGKFSLFFLTFPVLDSIGAIQAFYSIQVSVWICCIKRGQNCEQNKNDTEMTLPDLHICLLWAPIENQISNIIIIFKNECNKPHKQPKNVVCHLRRVFEWD